MVDAANTTNPSRRSILAIAAALSAGSAAAALGIPSGEEPATAEDREALLDAYNVWLDNERRWLAWERAGGSPKLFEGYLNTLVYRGHRAAAYYDGDREPASSRAAAVLAAAGCGWREDVK